MTDSFKPDTTTEEILFLSFELSDSTPAYANNGGFKSSSLSVVEEGRTANSSYWEFNNHLGTHIDFPRHFSSDGWSGSSFQASYFWLSRIRIIEMNSCQPGQVIGVSDLKKFLNNNNNIECLILKTGFGSHRGRPTYWNEGPAFHPDIFPFLRATCPELRFFGFDAISLTSLLHRDLGKKAHMAALLDKDPILIIEDMDLQRVNSKTDFKELVISPLRISDSDGGPVTVIAKQEDTL